MENAILAGQQKRQGLLLHLGGHDIPNLLSPENEEISAAASTKKMKRSIKWHRKGRMCGVHLCMTCSGTRPAQASLRVAAAVVTTAARRGQRRRCRVNGESWVRGVGLKVLVLNGGAKPEGNAAAMAAATAMREQLRVELPPEQLEEAGVEASMGMGIGPKGCPL